MRIIVVGTGYVGLSLGTLLSVEHDVIAADIDERKIALINDRKSPIVDKDIEYFMKNKKLNLKAIEVQKVDYSKADYVIICTPTNYDDVSNKFDTSSIIDVLNNIFSNSIIPTVIIKSTVPVGFTSQMREKYSTDKIIFSPEFLREGKALHDNLYPSRIIVGDISEEAVNFGNILKNACLNDDAPVLTMESKEAEAVKLFANTYLALRVSFFNELDTYAEINNLSSRNIIEGISFDPRIGNYYNNPSFGYGGYCLPKDTKQLLANYSDIPQDLISAVVNANKTRKNYIAESILRKKPKIVGIYRLAMKANSDNFRQSAIQDIIKCLLENNVIVQLYEPIVSNDEFEGIRVIKNFEEFINSSDLIVANRATKELNNVLHKVYTRDIFNQD